MVMAKPLRLLTPRERDVRNLERSMSKLKDKAHQLLNRASGEGYTYQEAALAEAVTLLARTEMLMHELRSKIHNQIKNS